MQKLIAAKTFKYSTRRLKAGDEFESRPEHVRLLTLTGLASAPAGEQAPAPAPAPKRKKRTYNRRDLKAKA